MVDDHQDNVGEERILEGLVLRSTGSWYDVQTAEGTVPSKVRGKFRLEEDNQTNPVVVGDRVDIRLNEDETGMIVEIHPRSQSLRRRAAGRKVGQSHVIAANLEFAWVVQSIGMPRFNAGFVDRFLVMSALDDLPAGIVINKIDLAESRKASEELKRWSRLYRDLGYPVIEASAVTGQGVGEFRRHLEGRMSVVAGPSGVGKSTLLNAVSPGLDLRTGKISKATRKGKHTTTVATLHALETGGYVVDTPGLREFGLIGLDPGHLSHYFPEMLEPLTQCRFPNCQHDHEPGCAVKDAVDEGRLDIERYDSYLGMLYSLRLGLGDVGR